MINAALSWQQAAAGTGVLAIAATELRRRSRAMAAGAEPAANTEPAADTEPAAGAAKLATQRRVATAASVLREAALLLGLFGLWQLAGSFSVMGPAGAIGRARWLWHAERVLHLPSEVSVQRAFLPHPLIVQIMNLYYDILHFPVLIGCLIWVFARHRDRYPRFRTTLVIFTGLCLLIQLIPVAPPRLLPGLHLVDTAVQYGQSVYASQAGFEADQLSAMPSVHVGWAILVAIAVFGATRSRWRWLALLYPALTSLVVVVTANHFWLDGVVAGAVLAMVLVGQRACRQLRARRSPVSVAPDDRSPEVVRAVTGASADSQR